MLTRSLAVIAAISLFCLNSTATGPLIATVDALDALDCASARVTAKLDLPGSQEPVEYTINFDTHKAPGDSLLPYSYLIDWTLHRRQGDTKGFSAYYDGTHMRFRDTRLQEYHAAEDVRPFMGKNAVQRQVQFADILPVAVAETLRAIVEDSTWTYKQYDRGTSVRIDATQRISGYDALEIEILINTKTHLPVSMTKVYNPASISEQEVEYVYQWADRPCADINEAFIADRYSDIFAKFRADNFKALSLVGRPLPTYALNDIDGQRHTHRRGEALDRPAIYAFINPEIVTGSQTVNDVHRALAALPKDVAVVWLTPENVTAEALQASDDESVFPSARSMIVDCGISSYPTLMFVDSNGVIADVIIGQNNNMAEIVTQQTLNLN